MRRPQGTRTHTPQVVATAAALHGNAPAGRGARTVCPRRPHCAAPALSHCPVVRGGRRAHACTRTHTLHPVPTRRLVQGQGRRAMRGATCTHPPPSHHHISFQYHPCHPRCGADDRQDGQDSHHTSSQLCFSSRCLLVELVSLGLGHYLDLARGLLTRRDGHPLALGAASLKHILE